VMRGRGKWKEREIARRRERIQPCDGLQDSQRFIRLPNPVAPPGVTGAVYLWQLT